MYCKKCGSLVDDTLTVCPQCGNKFTTQSDDRTQQRYSQDYGTSRSAQHYSYQDQSSQHYNQNQTAQRYSQDDLTQRYSRQNQATQRYSQDEVAQPYSRQNQMTQQYQRNYGQTQPGQYSTQYQTAQGYSQDQAGRRYSQDSTGQRYNRQNQTMQQYQQYYDEYEYQQGAYGQQPVINIINENNTNGVDPTYRLKKKRTALLLCIFLGYLGIHRYYLGKTGTGILWVLTGGLVAVGWIVDIIVIASGSMRDKWNHSLV